MYAQLFVWTITYMERLRKGASWGKGGVGNERALFIEYWWNILEKYE
jgi:hypothetical protein